MQDRKHDSPVRFREIKNGIGKARHDGSPDICVNNGKHFGELHDRIERKVHGGEESLAKARALRVVPFPRLCQVAADTPAEDKRSSH